MLRFTPGQRNVTSPQLQELGFPKIILKPKMCSQVSEPPCQGVLPPSQFLSPSLSDMGFWKAGPTTEPGKPGVIWGEVSTGGGPRPRILSGHSYVGEPHRSWTSRCTLEFMLSALRFTPWPLSLEGTNMTPAHEVHASSPQAAERPANSQGPPSPTWCSRR